MNREQQHFEEIVEHLRAHKFPEENLRLTFEFELRDPKTELEMEYAKHGKFLVLIFSIAGLREEISLTEWRQHELASEDKKTKLEFTKLGSLLELLCHLKKIYEGDYRFIGDYSCDGEYVPDPLTILFFRPRPRGGSVPVLKLTDEKRIEFFKSCNKLLPLWQALIALYDGDPEGDDWRVFAAKLDRR